MKQPKAMKPPSEKAWVPPWKATRDVWPEGRSDVGEEAVKPLTKGKKKFSKMVKSLQDIGED